MECCGCGNKYARITKTFVAENCLVEYCDSATCGNLKAPWMPDVYFPGPHFSEHLGDADNPNGVFVESKRHKARLLAAQGLREDGDRVHGSLFRGAKKTKRTFTPGFEKKLEKSINTALKRK